MFRSLLARPSIISSSRIAWYATSKSQTLESIDTSQMSEHIQWMREALREAEIALSKEEVPVGCIILHRPTNRIIARGGNQTNITKNGTRHCEFVALESLVYHHDPTIRSIDLAECTLYVTVEPCIMCGAALRLVGIGAVVYGCGNERFGGNGSTLALHESPPIQTSRQDLATAATSISPTPATSSSSSLSTSSSVSSSAAATPLPPLQGTPYPSMSGILGDEAIDILKRFYARGNQNIPLEKRHRKGVAAATAAAAAIAATVTASPSTDDQSTVDPSEEIDRLNSPTSISEPDTKRAKV